MCDLLPTDDKSRVARPLFFSFILGPEKIGSGTPTIGKAVLTPTAVWGG